MTPRLLMLCYVYCSKGSAYRQFLQTYSIWIVCNQATKLDLINVSIAIQSVQLFNADTWTYVYVANKIAFSSFFDNYVFHFLTKDFSFQCLNSNIKIINFFKNRFLLLFKDRIKKGILWKKKYQKLHKTSMGIFVSYLGLP